MKTRIFYGVAGEGLGHAMRVFSILEHLKIETHIFTWGEAFDFFEKEKYPYLHKIIGLPFGRNQKNQISIIQSVKKFVNFLWNYKSSFDYIVNQTKLLKPKLFITDFEPIIPRVAKKLKISCLSIDNQHKFSRCKFDLNWKLNLYAKLTGLFTEFFTAYTENSLISTFHYNFMEKVSETSLTNCFIRKCFEKYKSTEGNYLLVYYKKSCGDKILEILSKTKYLVKIYNAPKNLNTNPKFEYYDLCNEKFIKDLAGCKALLAAAGNQLIGEALYYGKPIFVVPEPNQPEQEINGHFLEHMNLGKCCNLQNLDIKNLDEFLNKFSSKSNDNNSKNGVYDAIKFIGKFLNEKKRKNSIPVSI